MGWLFLPELGSLEKEKQKLKTLNSQLKVQIENQKVSMAILKETEI